MFKESINKYKIIVALLISINLVIFIFVLQGDNYLLISFLVAFLSIVPFFYKYEKRKPEAREIIVVAVLISIAVLSRVMFAFTPAFKPTIAIIIIAGAAFGKESGFLTGSLTALISNMFFGQGPWVVYQVVLWGLIGYFSGVFNKNGLIDNNKYFRFSFALIAGITFSFLIDLLTTISSGYTNTKFLTFLIPALPFMAYYAFSNIVFLYFLYDPMMKKLNRVKLKYGLIDEKHRF